jgi:hypothetical protein
MSKAKILRPRVEKAPFDTDFEEIVKLRTGPLVLVGLDRDSVKVVFEFLFPTEEGLKYRRVPVTRAQFSANLWLAIAHHKFIDMWPIISIHFSVQSVSEKMTSASSIVTVTHDFQQIRTSTVQMLSTLSLTMLNFIYNTNFVSPSQDEVYKVLTT